MGKPEGVENEAVEQVAFADKIILNKIDLSNQEELTQIEGELKKLNPTASIQRTTHSKINPSDLLNIQAFELKRVLDFDPEFLDEDQEHQHDSRVSSVAVKIEADVNMEMLEQWIRRVITGDGANLYRYKGVIAVKGMPVKFVFQGVGMLFHGGFQEGAAWKPNEKRESRFVFIGKDLDHKFYKQGFLACHADQPLRFQVGTKVKANVGEWEEGTVVKLWDEGNAYRVELDDEGKTNVWAPIDTDHYVIKLE